MTSIKLIVTGAAARAEVDGELTAGMVGIPVTIQYDSAWDGLTKTLVCKGGTCWHNGAGVVKSVLNVENKATVAHEVMIAERILMLGVEGRNGDGTLVIPTVWAYCGKIHSSATSDADPSLDPELPVWQKILNQIGDLDELDTEAKENLVAAINEALTKGGGEVDEEVIPKIVSEYMEAHPPADGTDGEDGATFTPSVDASGILSWSNDRGLENPAPVSIAGKDGADGQDGEDGATFIPAVTDNGDLSWSNDKGLENPPAVNIRGPKGESGNDGADGKDGADGIDGKDGTSPTVSVSAIDGGHRITITDVSGEQIVDVMDGTDGKSTYEYAQAGGYTGTEEEFAAKLAEEDFVVTFTSEDGETWSADKTYTEIEAAVNVGKRVRGIADSDTVIELGTFIPWWDSEILLFQELLCIDGLSVMSFMIVKAAVDTMSDPVQLFQFSALTEDKIPTTLPNPNALTINGESYDGSKAVSITTPTGLPAVTEENNGAFLRVVDGAWTAVAVTNAEEVAF